MMKPPLQRFREVTLVIPRELYDILDAGHKRLEGMVKNPPTLREFLVGILAEAVVRAQQEGQRQELAKSEQIHTDALPEAAPEQLALPYEGPHS